MVVLRTMDLPESCSKCGLKTICTYGLENGFINYGRDRRCELVQVSKGNECLFPRRRTFQLEIQVDSDDDMLTIFNDIKDEICSCYHFIDTDKMTMKEL